MASKPKPTVLPPLDADEIDAVLLGLSLLVGRGGEDEDWEDEDGPAEAARRALEKIASILPPSPPPGAALSASGTRTPRERAAFLRRAMEAEQTVRLTYVDRKGAPSDRVVWPVDVSGDEAGDTFAAWCEKRVAFRHFRLDRVTSMEGTGQPMPIRLRILRLRWMREIDEEGW